MTDRKIFLTGANGYVGRNLIRQFVASGVEVTGLVRNEAAASLVTKLGAHAVIGDMLIGDLAPFMSGADVLIHAAADLDHGPGEESAKHNIEGTRRVLIAAKMAGIGTVIHLSTDSVLQDGRPLQNVNESTPYPKKPAGAYSRGKAKAEQLALSQASDDFRVVVLRPRFVWGRDDGTALPRIVENVRSGRFAWIAKGDYLSSTTHIANLCHAVELAMDKGVSGEIYHISDGAARTFRETLTGLLATQGLQAPEKSVPRGLLKAIARVSDTLYRLSNGRIKGPLSFQEYATSAVEISLDISKAERELGYVPSISWEQGLAELQR